MKMTIWLQDNANRMQALVDKLRTRIDKVVEGGGEKAIQRHTARGWPKLLSMLRHEYMT